eukprot:m.283688 g.283688  ORF g.283688 m.283688 type:complete len:697 (+) comp22906_c2_seq24:1334-3424(+)
MFSPKASPNPSSVPPSTPNIPPSFCVFVFAKAPRTSKYDHIKSRLDAKNDSYVAKSLEELSSLGVRGGKQASPRVPSQKSADRISSLSPPVELQQGRHGNGSRHSSRGSGSRHSTGSSRTDQMSESGSDRLLLPEIRAAVKANLNPRQPSRGFAEPRGLGKKNEWPSATELSEAVDDPELRVAVSSLDTGTGTVNLRRFEKVLSQAGLRRNDLRLKEMFEAIDDSEHADVPMEDMCHIARLGGQVVVDAITGCLTIPDWPAFKAIVQEIFDEVKTNTGGKNATYIPVLAEADPTKFAVAITTVDGQQMFIGDCETHFCLQSTSKPVTYGMALKEHGAASVHKHVGREPSGQAFNEMFLKQIPEGKRDVPHRKAIPHNPMINAGAIVCTSLVRPGRPFSERIQDYLKTWKALCCEEASPQVSFDPAVFVSERGTADRNQALAYMMKEMGSFPDNTDIQDTLELYFQTCSVTLSARNLAAVAASLANGGTNPFSQQPVFDANETRDILSLMLSCGMYDYSGEWAFRIGLPAKSGVSGNVMIVVPNVMGVAIYSPPLDDLGNSVRAVDFGHKLVQRFNFHMFDSLRGLQKSASKIDPTKSVQAQYDQQIMQFLRAAARGQMRELRGHIARGLDVNVTDYDRRSALHLAACEGHAQVVSLLVSKGARVDVKDRWGHSPITEAHDNGHTHVVELLKSALHS